MFSGAQISLYPMTDDFVAVILGALGALDPYRDRFRIETDDLSTLLVGPPQELFPAMRDLFAAAAGGGVHTVLSATVSRGCPGEPDAEICTPPTDFTVPRSLDARVAEAHALVAAAPVPTRMGRSRPRPRRLAAGAASSRSAAAVASVGASGWRGAGSFARPSAGRESGCWSSGVCSFMTTTFPERR